MLNFMVRSTKDNKLFDVYSKESLFQEAIDFATASRTIKMLNKDKSTDEEELTLEEEC